MDELQTSIEGLLPPLSKVRVWQDEYGQCYAKADVPNQETEMMQFSVKLLNDTTVNIPALAAMLITETEGEALRYKAAMDGIGQ